MIEYKRRGLKMKTPPSPLLKAVVELHKIEEEILARKRKKAMKEEARRIDKLYE